MSQQIFNAAFWFGPYSLQSNTNAIALDMGADEVDVSTMSATAWKEYIAGLIRAGISFSGLFEAEQPDSYLTARHTLDTVPMTIAPTLGAAGEVALIFKPLELSYERSAPVGDAFKINVTGVGNTPIVKGTVLGNTTYTSTTNGTAYQVGAALSTQTIYAALHVTSASAADTCDVKIQSSADEAFTSPNDRITFTQATAITSEWKTLAGAVTDTWWRVVVTIGGSDPSFAVVCSMGIK